MVTAYGLRLTAYGLRLTAVTAYGFTLQKTENRKRTEEQKNRRTEEQKNLGYYVLLVTLLI